MLIKLFPSVARRFRAGFYSCPIILLLISVNCYSQSGTFTAAPDNSSERHALLKKHESQFLSALTLLPKEYKKDLAEVYTLRWNNIKTKFEDGEVYTSNTAQQYLDRIVSEIRTSNPILRDKQFTCYFSRSGIPNASSLGEGVILINMGLFWRLDNESQLAFVICHEIAHVILQHSESAINEYVNRVNSSAYQKELRDIKNTTYGKRERLDQLAKRYSFDSRRHTRQNEDQADSMALQLLRKTTFDIKESLTTLALLNIIDKDTLNIEASLVKNFNAPGYPFQKRWLKKEQGLLGGHAQLKEETWADSLKTHPDCTNRITKLTPFVNKASRIPSIKIIDTALFQRLSNQFSYESIAFEFEQENYSRSLFYCLRLLEQHQKPGTDGSDEYVAIMIGKSLNSIYSAFKEHRLSKVTDLPSPGNSENYNTLCQFIQNLYAENVAMMNYHFLLKQKEQLSDHPHFEGTFESASINAMK